MEIALEIITPLIMLMIMDIFKVISLELLSLVIHKIQPIIKGCTQQLFSSNWHLFSFHSLDV